MGWLALTLRVPAHALPRVEALLELAGASAISLADAADTPILEPQPGTTPVWPEVTLRALFDEAADLGGLCRVVEEATPATAVAIDALADDALLAAEPVPITEIGPRLCIVPADRYVPGDARQLGLYMGLAFGTGAHPTTRLCLEWLEHDGASGANVLDYGCGSGILALAALKLGAASATAIDIEPQALLATERNAGLNGLSDALTIGSREPAGRYDLLLANILAEPLIALADRFADCLEPGSPIVMSGMLAGQLDDVERRFASRFERFERRERDGWGLLTAKRQGV